MKWANYSNEIKAHMRALIEVDQSKPGTSLEIYNISTGQHLATYTAVVGGIKSWHSDKMRFLLRAERRSKK
jgi:hypothetical protein